MLRAVPSNVAHKVSVLLALPRFTANTSAAHTVSRRDALTTRPRAMRWLPVAGATIFKVASTVALMNPWGSNVAAAATAAKSAAANTAVAWSCSGRKQNASCTGISNSTWPGSIFRNASLSVCAIGMSSTARRTCSGEVKAAGMGAVRGGVKGAVTGAVSGDVMVSPSSM